MFSEKQVRAILEKYAQDVDIHRGNEKIPHKGILMFGDEKAQRCDFGVVEKQSGIYVYSCESADLFEGDIMEFCGEKFLLSSPKGIYFKNIVVYKKVGFERF